MTNVYTENEILDRKSFSGSCSALTTILSARVRPEDSVLEMILKENKIGRPEHAQYKGFCFNLGKSKNIPHVYNFSIESDDVYMPLLKELGADYNPWENKGKVIAQVCGKHVFIYSEGGKIIALQPLTNEYSRSTYAMSRKKASGRRHTECLHAYAMFDIGNGDGWLWNEIISAETILPDKRYKQHTLEIKKAEYDEHPGELELELEKRSLCSDHTFILFYESSINLFLAEYDIGGIGGIKELAGKKLMVLSTDNDSIDWVIPYVN